MTRLGIASLDPATGDTLWTWYFGSKPAHCAENLSNNVIFNPLISSATYQKWLADTTATVLNDTTDRCTVRLRSGTQALDYVIDKDRWLVTAFKKVDSLPEWGWNSYADHQYEWADSNGIFVLQTVIFNGMPVYGYRFYNIKINGIVPDSIFNESSGARWLPRAKLSGPLAFVKGGDLYFPRGPAGSAALFDLQGKELT